MISVYDIDNTTPQLNDDDFLGQIETTLGQVSVGHECFCGQFSLPRLQTGDQVTVKVWSYSQLWSHKLKLKENRTDEVSQAVSIRFLGME